MLTWVSSSLFCLPFEYQRNTADAPRWRRDKSQVLQIFNINRVLLLVKGTGNFKVCMHNDTSV